MQRIYELIDQLRSLVEESRVEEKYEGKFIYFYYTYKAKGYYFCLTVSIGSTLFFGYKDGESYKSQTYGVHPFYEFNTDFNLDSIDYTKEGLISLLDKVDYNITKRKELEQLPSHMINLRELDR